MASWGSSKISNFLFPYMLNPQHWVYQLDILRIMPILLEDIKLGKTVPKEFVSGYWNKCFLLSDYRNVKKAAGKGWKCWSVTCITISLKVLEVSSKSENINKTPIGIVWFFQKASLGFFFNLKRTKRHKIATRNTMLMFLPEILQYFGEKSCKM